MGCPNPVKLCKEIKGGLIGFWLTSSLRNGRAFLFTLNNIIMPTVTIPDKICPHCGGNKWMMYTHKHVTKDGQLKEYTLYDCYTRRKEYKKTNRNKYIQKASKASKELSKKYYQKNIEKIKIYRKEYRENNKEKVKEINRKSCKKHILNLPDSYIKLKIIRNSCLKPQDIPQELVELKRQSMLLTRQTRNNGYSNNT
jgi:hypothetical protein